MEKTKLRIHTWPEKILRKKCREVKTVDQKVRGLLDEMCSLMKSNKGVGLAANQAGLDISLIVVDTGDRIFKLANPRILKKEGTISFREGCLSFPDLELEIKRSRKIWVSALNEKGEEIDLEAQGIAAVILQHEIDHINGIVFVDRVSLWERIKSFPQLRKIGRKKSVV